MSKPLISIIVPVYNTEKYLDQCIQSVLTQTYTNWELLLIDDGSTDSSDVICDKYAEQDRRIKVVHKKNTGVSDSKNLALDNAKGEYVIFLDSDDYWCVEDCLEQLIFKSQECGADIVRGEYRAVDEEGRELYKREIDKRKENSKSLLLSPIALLKDVIQREFFLWLSLLKRDAIEKIRFSPRIFLEDMEFYAKMFSLNDLKCVYLPIHFYAYRQRITSISHSVNVRKLSDSFGMCSVFASLAQHVTSDELKNYYYKYSVLMYYWTLETVASDEYYSEKKKIIEDLFLNDLQHKSRERVLEVRLNFLKTLVVVLPVSLSVDLLRVKAWFKNRVKNHINRGSKQ